jgi:FkbM family methyltransferase
MTTLPYKEESDWLEANVITGNSFDKVIVRSVPRSYGLADYREKRVLDIGGHIGSFAVYAMWKGASHVESVEPLPRNLELLRVNAHRWKFHVIEGAAVRDMDTPRVITSGAQLNNREGSNFGHSVLRNADFKNHRIFQHPAKLVDFEDLLEFKPQIIKIDCEGTEHELLEDYVAAPEVETLLVEVHFFDSKYLIGWPERLQRILDQGFRIVKGRESIIHGYSQYGVIVLMRS